MQEVVAGDVLLTVSAYLVASIRKWSWLPSDKNEDRAQNSITEEMCRGSRISSHCSEHIVEFDLNILRHSPSTFALSTSQAARWRGTETLVTEGFAVSRTTITSANMLDVSEPIVIVLGIIT